MWGKIIGKVGNECGERSEGLGKSGELVKITAYGVERLIEFIFSFNLAPTMNGSK